jgi:uncharacterized BrkB/YihY/UPF0761 family membrane protein
MTRESILSSEDYRFYGLMIALSTLVINTAPSFNKMPFPYPLYGLIAPFLILTMMFIRILYYMPKKVRRSKSKTKRRVTQD